MLDDFSRTVNEEKRGQTINAPVKIGNFLRPLQHRIIHAHLVSELRNGFIVGVIHRYADDLQAFTAIFLLEIDQPWHLDLARLAPRSPEIHHYRLAFQLGKLQRLALCSQLWQLKVRGWLAIELVFIVAGLSYTRWTRRERLSQKHQAGYHHHHN